MSKELIEKLRDDGKFLGGNFGKLMHEAADALEAKAAPVGEREAFEAFWKAGFVADTTKELALLAYQAGAAYQRQVHAEHEGPDYGDGPEFEGWAERSGQQPQSAEAGICPGCNGTGKGVDMGDCAQIACMCSGTGRITTHQPHSAEPVAFKKPSLLMDCNVRYSTSTTPQPSAGVVMPTLVVKESGEWGDAYERGFKAALREFARLNGKEVGRG